MKLKTWVIAVLALGALMHGTGSTASQSSLDMFDWLDGDWVRQTKRGEATESWRRVSDNTMEGVAYVTSGDSIRVSEYLRLERFGEDVFYTAKPAQNPFPTSFMLNESGKERVVFENPYHDFPQRIIYTRIGGDSLIVRIEGPMEGEERGIDFKFKRKK